MFAPLLILVIAWAACSMPLCAPRRVINFINRDLEHCGGGPEKKVLRTDYWGAVVLSSRL